MTAASPQAGRAARLAHLDGLRAGAALFVLLHHTFCMAYPIALGVRPGGFIGTYLGWMVYGHFGVTVFIALAGYSLALGIAGKEGHLPGGTLGFLRRRARRIIPPYWAALALTILLVTTLIGRRSGTHWDLSVPTEHVGWLADFLLVQDVAPGRDAAYTFWSIAVEWHIYLLLPIILLCRRLTGSWPAAVGIGAGGSLAVVLASRVIPDLRDIYPHYYLVFALAVGACVAVRLRPDGLAGVPWLGVAVSAAALVVTLCIVQPYAWVERNYYWIDVVLGVAVIALLVHVALRGAGRIARALSWRPLAGAGRFSYSIYLVHAPLLAVAWQEVIQPLETGRGAQLAVGWLVAVPVIVGCAYGFYLVFERPFLDRRPGTVRRDGVRGADERDVRAPSRLA